MKIHEMPFVVESLPAHVSLGFEVGAIYEAMRRGAPVIQRYVHAENRVLLEQMSAALGYGCTFAEERALERIEFRACRAPNAMVEARSPKRPLDAAGR